MRLSNQAMSRNLIAQHNLTEDEYEKIVEILWCEPNLTGQGT